MKVLWLCNALLPKAAERLGVKATNKEGWLVGASEALSKQNNGEITLAVAAPVAIENHGFKEEIDNVKYYGFVENTFAPELYDASLEWELQLIVEDFEPDVIHIFGTEYPHTLAMTRCVKDTSRILIGIQGVCSAIAVSYATGVPGRVIERRTFRDRLRRDSINDQIHKFILRGDNEKEAVKNVPHVTGRTDFDKRFVLKTNDRATYYHINETLRSTFYEGRWDINKAKPHSIFVSQCDYPVKGFHYVLEAAGRLKDKYPDISITVSGNVITAHKTIKEKIKISSYGKYLLELIKKYGLEDAVTFTGNVSTEAMKDNYLKASVFVLSSTIENSPNSLGEAMLLSMPCVAADVGGVTSIITDKEEGLVYEAGNVDKLAKAIDYMWTNKDEAVAMGAKASQRARVTHDGSINLQKLIESYRDICR